LFPVLIVDKRVESSVKLNWLHPYDRKIIRKVSEAYLAPIDKIKYFEPEQSFPIMGFLFGGHGTIILMGLVMVLCYKGMGKLAEAQMAPNAQGYQQHSVAGNRGNRRT
jgi:hypothetical protein